MSEISEAIEKLEARLDSLKTEESNILARLGEVEDEKETVETTIRMLKEFVEGKRSDASASLATHLSVQRSATTNISPRSPKSPTYGAFSGRYTIAPEPPTKPDHGPMPAGAGADWVSMIASSASPYALALAILRSHPNDFISSGELNARLAAVRGVSGGVGYTVLEPLQEAGIISGDHSAWRINERLRGGIIEGRFLWCDPQYLNIYDWAAIRREAITILLSEHPHVTNAAITKSLEKCEWLKSPITPHLVKADLRIMEKRKQARMNPDTKTWELVGEAYGRFDSIPS